jgi:hypothetical protein
MGEGQLRHQGAFTQQPRFDRRIHLTLSVGQPGDRLDGRHRRVLTQHRSGGQEGLSGRRERGHAGEDHRSQLPGRPQPPISGRAQPDNADLVEQRPAVEGVSFGMGGQSPCSSPRKHSQTQRARQLGQITRAEAAQPDASDTRVAADETGPSWIGRRGDPSRHDRQHLVGPQPPQSEQQRPRRLPVSPLKIVDGEHHDLTVGPHPTEQIEQPGPYGHRVGRRLGLRAGLQLIDDPIGEQRLLLVPTDCENDGIRQRVEEPGK